MANDGNRIYIGSTGVEIYDLQRVLGRGVNDLGLLCSDQEWDGGFLVRANKTNKWAMCKPVRLNKLGLIDNNDRASVHCGLTPVSVPKIIAKSIFYNGGSSSYTEQDGLGQISEWNYNPPRGKSSNEWFRLRDFEGYDHRAIAPDSGWSSREYTQSETNQMAASSVSVTTSGAYSGRNFLISTYNGSDYGIFYSGFNMRFGDASSESIGTITHMDIPIKYITELSGNWRLCLAVWVPAHGNYSEGWGLFVSNSTIAQFFVDHPGSASNMRDLLPNLTSNPVAATYIKTYVESEGGYAQLDAVPMLIKDVTYGYNGQNVGTNFAIRADSQTEGYCMPSGNGVIEFHFGTPPTPIYYRISYKSEGGLVKGYLSNTDTTSSHVFAYTVSVNGTVATTGTATMSAGENERQVYATPTGNSLAIVVTEQDGTPI